MIWQQAWFWAAAGVVLAALEMVTPGFYLLGLGFGALVVALLVWIGLLGASLPWMIFVMALGALAAWLALRRWAGVWRNEPKIWDRDINED
ncbi:NfeD family protein [Phaeovulum sp.]|uniref:NfeD family protein n=1 Tax=Phaeovulum sp. TaxID=2934796 RepID=UPI00356AA78E